MEECTHRKRMPPVPAKVNGHDSRTEKGIKSNLIFLLLSLTLYINLKSFA
jgi:hypothetical protein